MAMDRETMSYEYGLDTGTAIRIEPNAMYAGLYSADVLRDMAPAQELIPFVVEVLDFDEAGTFTFQTAPHDIGEWYVLREEFVYGKLVQTDADTSAEEGTIEFLLNDASMVRKVDGVPGQLSLEGRYVSTGPVGSGEDSEGIIQAYALDELGGNFSRSELNDMWNLMIMDDDGYMDQVGGFTINAMGVPSHAELPIIGGTVDSFDDRTGAFQMTIDFSDEGGWTGQFRGFMSGSGNWLFTEEYDDTDGEWEYSGRISFFRSDLGSGQDVLEGYWCVAATEPYVSEDFPLDGILNVKLEDNGNGSYNVVTSAPADSYYGTAFAIGNNKYSIALVLELPSFSGTPYNGQDIVFWVVFTADEMTPYVEYASFMLFDSSSGESDYEACLVAPYTPPGDVTQFYSNFEGSYTVTSPFSPVGTATVNWDEVEESMDISFQYLWGDPYPVHFQGDPGLLSFSIDSSALGYDTAENIVSGIFYHFAPPNVAGILGMNKFSNNTTLSGSSPLSPLKP